MTIDETIPDSLHERSVSVPSEQDAADVDDAPEAAGPSHSDQDHATLKYSLLGPSLTKAGQDSVSEIIYNASKGSKFFNREEDRDKTLTVKIDRILRKKRDLERLDLSPHLRRADALIAELELSRDLTQHIVHLDCDAFYAAVEQLDRPELNDLPFAVGGGVLTTCNYIARKFGCRSGMAGFVAKKLCPDLIFIPLNFDKYTAKAAEVREVIAEYDPRFESASIDEAYLNITAYCQEHNMQPEEAVAQMRRQVHERTSITVSAGIAANAKLAKICSNMNKPNGQFLLPNDRTAIMSFMRDLPCRKVNGIGRVWERELAAVGIKTCGDIYTQREFLNPLFGEKAYEFLLHCHLGLGRTNVQPAEEYERKSVGTESTFGDLADPKKLREKLRWTAEELEKDMRRAQCKGRTLVLKVKLHTFEVYTRQAVMPKAICLADDLYNYALPILTKLEQEMPGMRIRLMGLRCTHLVSTKKPDTRVFFGLKPRSGTMPSAPGKVLRAIAQDVDDDGWEKWPEEEIFIDSGYEPEPEPAPGPDPDGEAVPIGQNGTSPYRRHGKEIVPNPTPRKESSPAQEAWWECPICSRPQAANEKLFNDHIDACLSRQAIREAVQKDSTMNVQSPPTRRDTPEPKHAKLSSEKKRGRPPTGADPKQKKICFG
ncbi:hypothetical protein M406DRAFT_76232 [Cryphonectria parasitica EP155]|uniref:DNA polymerase kappa n=1 Tax=Cryphonectria parasitica (strain ATCC 38755 / EP155) TaxID=660469 RepID=A0A9P4XWF8_CRYP1|nr:uncharacterized protein M406DRAFT_76232 [Cryphonectria parasitica EP155]KAF3762072.1 hypothetical protein M406DRAFT_76232 [Cryphonectria parasitica EP155]